MKDVLPVILRAADLRAAGLSDSTIYRRLRRGELVSVAPGSFVSAVDWESLSCRDRYAVRVRARLARLSSRVVASHDSAAVMWGMPTLDGWPGVVHVLDPTRSTALRRGGLQRHPSHLGGGDIRSGSQFSVTSPARTAVDLALRDGFTTGLLLFDHGLRAELFTEAELLAALDAQPTALRLTAATRALENASPLAESPGESISRAAMILLGFDPPELQRRFFEGGVEIARTDFWWEGVGVAGEFDGDEKYKNAEMRRGRTADEVVIQEKWRAEALLDRPEVTRVVRWNYAMARNPDQLAERLIRAGVPRRRPRRPSPPEPSRAR
jgi:hypothetical protein